MKIIVTLLLFLGFVTGSVSAQKMLIIEQANVAKTTRLYPGDRLIFRLEGEENYWYDRTITEILPETNSLLLDNYLVKLDDIVAIKIHKKTIWRIVGGSLLSFGVSLGFATGVAAIYGDDYNYPALAGASVGSFLAGRYLLKRKKVRLGERFRLRIIEVKF